MNVAKVITAVQLLLMAILAIFIVRAAMVFVSPEAAWTPLPQNAKPLVVSNASVGANSPSTINTNFDPFHRSVTAVTEQRPIAIGEDAPETSLDLTLMGTFTGDKGLATLRLPDGKQKSFRIDDEILQGVTLKAVNIGFIVISQDGRLERLTFVKANENTLRGPKAPVAAAPEPSNASYEKNPLLDLVDFIPQRANNEITGYKLTAKQPGLNTALSGLEDGDIITSIGRISLQDEGIDFGAVLSRLQSRRSTNVELIRNGQEISVKVGTP